MRLPGISFVALFLFASVGRAAPFKPSDVSAAAVWVAHVDVDVLRDSYILKKAVDTFPAFRDLTHARLETLKEKGGVDLSKDLHGVTVYGKDADKRHSAMIVYADVNRQLMIDKANKTKDHKVTRHGDYEIHSWRMSIYGKSHMAAGAFFKSNVIVYATTPEGVAGALDVLGGKIAALANDSPLARSARPGTTLLARSKDVNPHTPCPVLAQAASFRVAMGERNSMSFFRANIAMKSHDAAEETNKVFEGLSALVALRDGSDADVMKLVHGLKTTVEGDTLKVRWDAAGADVWTVIEKQGRQFAEHMGNHGRSNKSGKGSQGKNSLDDDF